MSNLSNIDGEDLEYLFDGEDVLTSDDGLVDFMVSDGVLVLRDNVVGEWIYFDHSDYGIMPSDFPDQYLGGAGGFGAFPDILQAGYEIVAEALSQIPDQRFQQGFSAVDKAIRPEHHEKLERERRAKKAKADQRKRDQQRRNRRKPNTQESKKKRRENIDTRRKKVSSIREARKKKPSILPGGVVRFNKVDIKTTVLGFLSARYHAVKSGDGNVIRFKVGGEVCELEF